jgi:hypothetical protein
VDGDVVDIACNTGANIPAGTCSLRAAVMQANRMPGNTTIILPAGTYTLTRLPTGANGDDNGDLNLTAPAGGNPVITISGSGPDSTSINANSLDRVFSIDFGRKATIGGVTVSNGLASGAGGIFNHGALTVSHCTVSGNRATSGGGGGIWNDFNATLAVLHSVLRGNRGEGSSGGAVINLGEAEIDQSTIHGNSADYGAGIYNVGDVVFMTNADADPFGSGGGVYNVSGDQVYLRNTVLAGNFHSGTPDLDDCTGALGAFGRNKVSTLSGCTITPQNANADVTFIGSLSELGALKANGGSSPTHALLPPSNLIDGASPNSGCVNKSGTTLLTDQRGGARGTGMLCDLGAFEYGALPAGRIFADGFELGNLWEW